MTIRYGVTVLLVAASCCAQAQGDRAFCDDRNDGWYTHPVCHYLYKCQNHYTYEVPVKLGLIVGADCTLPPGGTAAEGSFCATRNAGLYPTADCGTYTLCKAGKASQHVLPKDTLVCTL